MYYSVIRELGTTFVEPPTRTIFLFKSPILKFLFQYNIDGSNVNEETVGHLRQRLNVMREIVKVSWKVRKEFSQSDLVPLHLG